MRKPNFPIGSVSSGTMQSDDLISAFSSELRYQLRNRHVTRAQRKSHNGLLHEISAYESGDTTDACDEADDLVERLFDALNEYAAPYFYFGAHPGDGADYGYWLSEEWDQDFQSWREAAQDHQEDGPEPNAIKVNDLSEVPSWFRGEVAVVNDHGNVTLYVKTARGLREIWSVV